MSGSGIDDVINNLLLTLKENYGNDLTRTDGSGYRFERFVLLKCNCIK